MVVHRKELEKAKKHIKKRLAKKIKEDPAEYEAAIEDLRNNTRILDEVFDTGVDDDILKSCVDIAESGFYEALAHGVKRKDIAFYEEYLDNLKIRYKEEIKKRFAERKNVKHKRLTDKDWDKMLAEIDELDKLFAEENK